MRPKIVIYGFSIICGLLVVACKKYPDGGYIYRRDSDIKGSWELTLYEVNGIDSTELINYSNIATYKQVIFTKPNSSDKDIYIQTTGLDVFCFFVNSNKDLNFYTSKSVIDCATSNTCYKNYFVPEEGNSASWQVIKLTSTDMTLTLSLTNSYKLKFKK